VEKKVIIKPEEINLFHIQVNESVINAVSEKKKQNYAINVGHVLMHNLELERLKINMVIELKSETSVEHTDAEISNAHFNIEFHFQIKNLKNFYTLNEKGSPVFHGLLIATLLGLSFSTARGIVYERLRKTTMEGIILPIVSPQKMMSPTRKPKE